MTIMAGRWNTRSTPQQDRTADDTRRRRRRAPRVEALEGRTLLSGTGALDTTFNGTGIQTASLLNGPAGLATNATVVQPDGKTLVVGEAFTKQGNGSYPAV